MEKEKLISLVTKAQSGDNGAMEQLFSAFYNDVYYFALKTVKDSDTACDITQEAFLEVIRTIGELKEPAAFVTWMKQITYHQCTRYFKKKKEVLVEEDEDGNTVFDTLADESEDSIPSEVLEKEDFRKTILGIINELTEEQRSAVMMFYFDELTVAQIAQIQGVSDGTVKSRLNYARKALKKSVEDYEKKNNIKLHSISILPLLLLFFGKEAMPEAKAAEVGQAIFGAAKAVATGAKLASIPLIAKILAGVVAVSLVAGGVVLAGNGNKAPETQDTIPTTETQETLPEHYDLEFDGYCDQCGEAMCILGMPTLHWDEDQNCQCDACGYVEHFHGQGNACDRCDTCNMVLGILDLDADEVCDLCGQGHGSYIHPHLDEDGDDKCDGCQGVMCGLVWDLEHTIDYSDGIYDGKCDACGGSAYPIGWGGDEGEIHSDANGDGECEQCRKKMCQIYGMPEFGGVDADGDEKCDVCKLFMCDGHDGFTYHYDFDHDGKCDRCSHYICAHGYVPHTDNNGDGKCDLCYAIA